MATIKPNCREQLTPGDFALIANSLAAVSRQPSASTTPQRADCRKLNADSHDLLTQLLSEPEGLDAALESDRLFKSLLESPATITVTPQLYFYVLVRRMLH